MNKKILVTCAFPYANGPIHIGHILEHIQADIWVRYNKMRGNKVWFICADDAHGTPIMLKSKQLGINPEQLIISMRNEHIRDLLRFNINYDNYYSTHSTENLFFLKKIYYRLKIKGLIKKKIISQFFDYRYNMFLPDRFVKGSCPICSAHNQYGDHCEQCGRAYSAVELVNPRSVLSGVEPVLKDSLHLFFDLPYFSSMLRSWITSGVLEQSVVNKIMEWFKTGLKDWDISRDGPYFGFNIPGFSDKYFYVWLDAPIGYISTFQNLCNKTKNLIFDEFWKIGTNSELYHFIGKDIIYFHSLFWPAILEGSNFRKPTKIFVHGHVTINGCKLSKSRGSSISVDDWLKNLDSDSLRYYYATKISSNVKDIEINRDSFVNTFNSDIVNKVINLASRISYFLSDQFNCRLSKRIDDQSLYNLFVSSTQKIELLLEQSEFSAAIIVIMECADMANKYIDKKKPWTMVKDCYKRSNLHNVCTMGINCFRILMTWLKPIMPDLAKKVELFLNMKLVWNEIYIPLLNHEISVFKPLNKRIKKSQLNFLFI
ncbi:MAG: methionine--tRNA ligase [Buchnera aphidicola (Meitanaphis microgallis)]